MFLSFKKNYNHELILLFNMMQSVCMVNYFVNKSNVYIVTDHSLLRKA